MRAENQAAYPRTNGSVHWASALSLFSLYYIITTVFYYVIGKYELNRYQNSDFYSVHMPLTIIIYLYQQKAY